VAFGAGAYAVTFHATGRQARARRVAADGSLLDVAEVPLGPGYDARVAFDGARFTCIFSDDGTAAGQGRLFGVRLPREGAPIDASPRLLVSGIKPSYEVYDSSYDVGGDASGAVVVFVDSADSVLSFHLDRELAATAASPLRESGWAYQTPVLVAGARSALPALGAWLLDWPMPTVVGAALDVDGRPTAPLATVSVGVATQRSPAVARGPQGYLLAWIERRAALAADVRALRLDAEGAPLEVGSRWLATVTGEAYDVHAASDGQDFLVAFAARDVESAQSSLRAIRVRGDGVPLDPLPVPVMESLERGDGRDVDEVSVAFGGGSYLLAAGIRQASSRRIGMARLGRDGSLLGGPGPILLGEEGANRPRLDFDGARFGIAYIQPTTTGVYEEHARFRFVRPDGVVGEPIALPFPGYRDSGGVRIDDVTLTWDGARHVLATFNPAREVLALRVSAAGELLDPEPARLLGTDPVPANQYLFYPTLAAGAEGVLFVYKTLDPTAVLARLLSPALAPVGGASEIGVTAVRTVGDAPSIVLGPGGRALLVYAHGAAGDEGGSERLRWRVGVADFTTVPAAPDAGMDAPPDAAPPADAGMDAAADAAPPADAGMDAVADAGVVADSGGGDAAGSPETGADRDRSTDAGGDGGAVASAPGAPKSGCSCAIVRRADGGGWLLAPLALAVVLACGRRRGARRTA
jgi:hypothetical protein